MGAFAEARGRGRRLLAVVGRDPRASGEFLEAAVVAGLAAPASTSSGWAWFPLLPSPTCPRPSTPTWAWCCPPATTRPRTTGSSSSRSGGLKLPDAVEDQIERTLSGLGAGARLAGRAPLPGAGSAGFATAARRWGAT